MKVAVTGGSGQLGTHVLARLIADPDVESVVSIDVRPPADDVVASSRGKLRAVTADVRDPDLARRFEGCDALAHLAFLVVTRATPAMEEINVGGSKNVFRAAASAGVKTVAYTSSIAAYGVLPGHPVPLTEEAPRRRHPTFTYSRNKYDVEAFLDEFEPAHPEMAISRLRPVVLVGARMDHTLGDSLRAGFLVDTGATAPIPLVWDEDVADAVVLAMKTRARGAFNLSADDPLPVSALARATGLRAVRVPHAALARFARATAYLERVGLGKAVDPAWVDHLDVAMVSTSAKARDELGWRPRCRTNVDVIARYLEVAPPVPVGKQLAGAIAKRVRSLGA